jgi:hypothetical protein
MHYHLFITDTAEHKFWWTNLSKEDVIRDALIPFINGQVVPWTFEGEDILLNMKTVNIFRIYKSRKMLSDETDDLPDFNTKGCKLCIGDLTREVRKMQTSESLSSLLQISFSKPKNQVFVIMQFGNKLLDSAYEGVIKPLIEKYGMNSLRIDEIQDSGTISEQILEAIAASKIIVADLSGERPNCYYETGFAHAIGKEIILSVNRKDNVHFDLAGFRFIVWETEAELRKRLEERLRAITERRKKKVKY